MSDAFHAPRAQRARRVLLLGGSGCLGTHVAQALRAAGHHVTVVARTAPAGDAVEVLVADRRDPASLAAALDGRRFDLTVDFLAWDAADVERLHPLRDRLGHYVLISTGQVYLVGRGGEPPFAESDAEHPQIPAPAEGTPDHAEWSYGVGKRRAEAAAQAGDAPVTVLRLPIVQGAGDRTLRLWAWLERMLDGSPVLLPEGGAQSARFVWAGDVGRAIARLADAPPRSGTYNLAPPDTLALREFLERAARAAGRSPRWVEASWGEIDEAGIPREAFPYAGRWVSVLDPSRARAELGIEASGPATYLPAVVRAHLERRPGRSHSGYVHRPREIDLASRRGAARSGAAP